MAELFVGPIMEKIIGTCFEYLEGHLSWQIGHTGMKELEKRLRENHLTIQAVLSAASQAHIIDQQGTPLNKWIWQLRDAIDEADDLLDEFAYMEHEKRLAKNKERTKMSSGGAGGEQPSRRSILSFRRTKQTTRGPLGQRPDQAAGDSTPTPSPHSPAGTTPPPPPPPETQAPTPTQMDAAEDRRILITPEGDTFHPSKYVTPRITEIIKSLFDGPYYSWRKVPNQVQEIWFREFTKYFIWLPEHTDRVRKNFGTRCSCRLRDMFTDLRKSGQKPAWIGDDVWLQLLAEWAKPEYVQMREKNKQNRASDAEGSGTSLHTGGSIPHTEHRRRLRESLGREPTMAELHQRTHQRQSNKEWVDQRSSTVHSEYMRLREQSQASEGQASQTADFDAWREAAGGKKKGKIYGLDSVGHGEGTSSQSADSVDSSGSTLKRMIQRAMDPFARRFEEHTRELSQLREEFAQLRQRPNIPEEDDEESTD